jgi:hypothetical protein
MLRTIEDMYGLPYAGHSDTAHAITTCFDNTTSVQTIGEAKNYSLSQNFPNPFNPSTKIDFEIPKSGMVSLKVFNSLGEEKAELVNTNLHEGKYEVELDAKNLSSGVYFYTLEEGDFMETKSMMLIK